MERSYKIDNPWSIFIVKLFRVSMMNRVREVQQSKLESNVRYLSIIQYLEIRWLIIQYPTMQSSYY